MSTEARTFVQKLAAADFNKIARWSADRVLSVRNRLRWHAARLRMQLRDALALPGKLPPGSLAASGLRNAYRDDMYYLKQFHQYGRIFKMFWASGDLKVCIVGFEYARGLLQKHRSCLHPVAIDLTPLVPDEYLRSMRSEIHPHYRSAFAAALRKDLITGMELELRQLIRDELDRLSQAPRENSALAKALYDTLYRIATTVLVRFIFGVRPDSAIFPALRDGYERLGPDGYVAAIGPAQRAAFPQIRATLVKIIESLRSGDTAVVGDSVLKRMALAADLGVDETVIGNAVYMVERGRHDMRDLLYWFTKHLSDHPQVVADLRSQLAMHGNNSRLAEACVLETLRLEQAEVLVRKALVAFTLEGYHIPKGSWVCTLMRESHRDPSMFPEPDRYRPQRFLERVYSSNEYAPFGLDEHNCIGRVLVTKMGVMFIEELVTRYDWTIAADGPRVFGHFHWQPSRSFAIDLQRKP